MATPATIAPIGAGSWVVFGAGKMRAACPSLARVAENTDLINKIAPFQLGGGL